MLPSNLPNDFIILRLYYLCTWRIANFWANGCHNTVPVGITSQSDHIYISWKRACILHAFYNFYHLKHDSGLCHGTVMNSRTVGFSKTETSRELSLKVRELDAWVRQGAHRKPTTYRFMSTRRHCSQVLHVLSTPRRPQSHVYCQPCMESCRLMW